MVAYQIHCPILTTLGTAAENAQVFSAYAANMANLAAPAANTTFPIFVRGIVRTTGSAPSSPLGFSFNSEVAASAVTIMTGSFIRLKKLV